MALSSITLITTRLNHEIHPKFATTLPTHEYKIHPCSYYKETKNKNKKWASDENNTIVIEQLHLGIMLWTVGGYIRIN